MLSPTAQGPARESKKSKPHHQAVQAAGGSLLDRQRRRRSRRSRGEAVGGRRATRQGARAVRQRPQATAASGRPPGGQYPARSGRGATGTGPEPARGTRHPARRPALRQRQGRRQSPRGKSACAAAPGPAPRRPAAGAAPGNRYDLVSILNFFDLLDL